MSLKLNHAASQNYTQELGSFDSGDSCEMPIHPYIHLVRGSGLGSGAPRTFHPLWGAFAAEHNEQEAVREWGTWSNGKGREQMREAEVEEIGRERSVSF